MQEISPSEAWALITESFSPEHRENYINSLIDLIREQAGQEITTLRILDVSAGTGYPSIELATKGLNISCTDGDQWSLDELSRRLKGKETLDINVLQSSTWDNLRLLLGEEAFDIVLCTGNSLAYVDGWQNNKVGNWQDRIVETIKNFKALLKPTGICIIGTQDQELKDGVESGVLEWKDETGQSWQEIYTIRRNNSDRLRIWNGVLKNGLNTYHVAAQSYLFSLHELSMAMRAAGLKNITDKRPFKGSEVFLGGHS